MNEHIETMTLDNLRVVCAFIAFIIALLSLLTLKKKHEQSTLQFDDITIFRAVALCILEIDLLCFVFGILRPFSNNSTQLFISIFGIIVFVVLFCYPESKYKNTQAKISGQKNLGKSEVELPTESPVDKENVIIVEEHKQVVLPASLNTPLAKKIFAKAIKEGYIKEVNGHYKKNNMSKALLTYMCGRIYCGDESERVGKSKKHIWKHGDGTFPESDLNELFDESGLAQARYNRPGTAVPKGFESIDILFE